MASENTIDVGPIPGAEDIKLQEGNSHGVLLLHGFGDTPQALRLLAAELHASGYDVVAPLLPGHGRNVESFMRSRRSDWLACARGEFARMRATHETVALAGLSMGGVLAAILASETPATPSLVLLAPYLDMTPKIKIAAATQWIWNGAAGARTSTSPNSILDPSERAKSLGYGGVYSGRLLYELWRLGYQGRRALASVKSPTLLIQSRTDPRVASAVAESAFAAIGAEEKKLVWIEGAGHVITVDYGRAKVFEETKRWIVKHTPAKQ